MLKTEELFRELSGRRKGKNTNRGKQKVETKSEYKARNAGKSCDNADSFCQLQYLIRHRGKNLPGMEHEERERVYDETNLPASVDFVHNLSYTEKKKKSNEPIGMEQWDKINKRY